MNTSSPIQQHGNITATASGPQATTVGHAPIRIVDVIYSITIALSCCFWLMNIRTSLWIDETGSYWMIEKGLRAIWSRDNYMLFPAYTYILWLGSTLFGTSEAALRIPSVLAMFAAVYLLYLAAREFLGHEIALIAVIVFSLHPIVIREAVDARPYAFAVLATNAAIYVLARLRNNDSNRLAAFFGILAALILYFHFLFGTILPALLLGFVILKRNSRAFWRQFAVMLVAFAVSVLPLLATLQRLFHAPKTHVFEAPPRLIEIFLTTLTPLWWIPALALAVVLAAKLRSQEGTEFTRRSLWICILLALIPISILYGVSAATPIRVLTLNHRLVVVPGLSLCWAMAIGMVGRRSLRLLICALLLISTAGFYAVSPSTFRHQDTWRDALQAVQKAAAPDNAPVLLCSDFPESDSVPMPVGSANDSRFFSPLAYYKLTVPVVPLPRALNGEAMRVASDFLQQATPKRQRFFAVAFQYSQPTLDWIAQSASGAYTHRTLGVYDGVKVEVFVPRVEEPAGK